ncbi:helicase-associated domain-containing protein [Microbacterium oryzae]|uniref:helicase-associated domain-containing protein n=1 Tax=Microbacterium oryzae TaxID=743009 RepID=UPI0025B068B6|nr:helicase-associated domain-containing protein [Microbacterium oryzae]MDN3311043.1 helicase-associated domain-containing protein [Microbacterium oryzae]
MSGGEARELAEQLAALSDADLRALLTARRIQPQVGWHDFFDAAEALLAPESIASALRLLPRGVLAALAGGRPVQGGAVAASLVGADGRALPRVAAALADVDLAPADAPPPRLADDAASARAAERAFTTLSALADVLVAALSTPLTRVGSGSVAAADRRRLLQEEVARDADELDDLVRLGEVAGLLHALERAWVVTAAGADWVQADTRVRWERLTGGWRDALPEGVRSPAGGWLPPAAWAGAYPLDPSWPESATTWLRLGVLLGLGELLEFDAAETAWARPLREGTAPDASALVALLPGEVDRVFLQNDLTAISPGPLVPALEVRLRGMATRETHAQASTYRFSEATLSTALAAGETAEAIRAFLSELSLTGIPQPLDYLLSRAAERHGLVQVRTDPDDGRTLVTSVDPRILETIAVDQALQPIALVRAGGALRTRISRDAVARALAEARYPAVAVDESGAPVPLRHGHAAPPPNDTASSRFDPLIARLRAAHGEDAEAAWLERELESAVRARALVVVAVAMPDGAVREFTLEASGMAGGRLRGRDRAADVERTLPVALIRSVRPA